MWLLKNQNDNFTLPCSMFDVDNVASRTNGILWSEMSQERWRELLEVAVSETDPDKFMSLISEASTLLGDRLRRNPLPEYAWEGEYHAAVRESDSDLFKERVAKAQEMMVTRRVQLHASRREESAERRALDEALGILRVVKNERIPPLGKRKQ
jgi:hypothetical protein